MDLSIAYFNIIYAALGGVKVNNQSYFFFNYADDVLIAITTASG